jgi:hypothetical protein
VKYFKSQITNNKQITMTRTQSDKPVWVIGVWCLEVNISDDLNTRDRIFKDYLSIGYCTVKFQARLEKAAPIKGLSPEQP